MSIYGVLNEYRYNDTPIFNRVWYINDDIVLIRKGEYSVVVAKDNKYIIVFDPTTKNEKGEYFNCLAHKRNTPKEIYEKWLHIIGKMISKAVMDTPNTKYFGDHDWNYYHLTNGSCVESDYPGILKLQKKSMKIINSQNIKESKNYSFDEFANYINERC